MHTKDIKEVAKKMSVTTQTIRNWIKNGKFIAGKKISEKSTLWRQSEIDNFFGAEQGKVSE
jgi:predicted DNA-binding transcriptional regulator AlpA